MVLWKIPMLFMGKFTISTGLFSIAMLNYQRYVQTKRYAHWMDTDEFLEPGLGFVTPKHVWRKPTFAMITSAVKTMVRTCYSPAPKRDIHR